MVPLLVLCTAVWCQESTFHYVPMKERAGRCFPHPYTVAVFLFMDLERQKRPDRFWMVLKGKQDQNIKDVWK